MASNKVTKAKVTKKAVAKPSPKRAKGAPETSRDVLEERLEFLLTCIKETGMKVTCLSLIHQLLFSTNITHHIPDQLRRCRSTLWNLHPCRVSALSTFQGLCR